MCEIKERLDSICHGQAGATVIQPMLETFEVSKNPKYAARFTRLTPCVAKCASCKITFPRRPQFEVDLMFIVIIFAEKVNGF